MDLLQPIIFLSLRKFRWILTRTIWGIEKKIIRKMETTTDFGSVNLMLKFYFLESNAQRKYQTVELFAKLQVAFL
jgi:hypothetical protein